MCRLPLRLDAEHDADRRTIDEIALARRHGLSVYDAAYLAFATASSYKLATLDRRLAAAASTVGAYFTA